MIDIKNNEDVTLSFKTENLMLFNPKNDKAIKSDLYNIENEVENEVKNV